MGRGQANRETANDLFRRRHALAAADRTNVAIDRWIEKLF
jgi:hypothetical protein